MGVYIGCHGQFYCLHKLPNQVLDFPVLIAGLGYLQINQMKTILHNLDNIGKEILHFNSYMADDHFVNVKDLHK